MLKGVNLGSWLLMEGYILGGRNIPEYRFKQDFLTKTSKKELKAFEQAFRKVYIQKQDFARISSWGANCVRLPFHYRLIESQPYKYSKEGLSYLKKAVLWAREYGLKVILDLHAGCGSQNTDWHSDSSGKALLWQSREYRQRTCRLWAFLAEVFKDEEAVYGYDILNEPVLPVAKEPSLAKFYQSVIASIRKIDTRRIIFLEGNLWAQRIDFLESVVSENDDKIAISIHFYHPLSFTFNFVHNLRYPGKIEGENWNRRLIREKLRQYYDFSRRHSLEIYVGEFGVNSRAGFWGEYKWVDDTLSVFQEYGFSWTYWTYKCVSRGVFPDGIIQYLDNPAWVRREGPVYGWENWPELWKQMRRKIIDSWYSTHFRENTELLKILKRYFA